MRRAVPLPAEAYIARLIQRATRWPSANKWRIRLWPRLVDRDIIRIITRHRDGELHAGGGTPNYICAVYLTPAPAARPSATSSTGEFCATAFAGEDARGHIINELGRFSPARRFCRTARRRTGT